jgi:hypothetical protein
MYHNCCNKDLFVKSSPKYRNDQNGFLESKNVPEEAHSEAVQQVRNQIRLEKKLNLNKIV